MKSRSKEIVTVTDNPCPGGFEWTPAEPESQGLSSDKLNQMCQALALVDTKALLVIRNDRVVCEWYADDHGPDKKHYTASLAKSLVGGVSLMLAMTDSLIRPDEPACKYIPDWRDDPMKSRITIRHLATHSSGIENAEMSERDRTEALAAGTDPSPDHMSLPGWKGAFWRQEPDPFTISRDQAPAIFDPGSRYAYSNTGMAMLAYAVTAAIRNRPHNDIRTMLRERIMRPIGVADEHWEIGYGRTDEVDGLPLVANWGGGSFTARAVARVGRLMLRRGDWQGTRLIAPRSLDAVTRPCGPLPDSGPPAEHGMQAAMGWFSHQGRAYSAVPRNAFAGSGAGQQLLLVIPHLDMIVVRNGSKISDDGWGAYDKYVVQPLMAAVLPSHKRSPVISGVDWAPKETVKRDAWDSDTWPVTWGDDDKLYAAWADGRGFADNETPDKTSLGFAEITGPGDDFHGRNIRSVTGEDLGDGPRGKKACGILMVAGVLYLWARNADRDGNQSQLAWSEDHGKSWTWSDWRFEEFGTCTFLNFGRDYNGARDDYVYVYSHDDPSAYIPADRMILARVPKGSVRRRGAYEFYAGQDETGVPTWSADVARREAVFTHKGRCCRSTVCYDVPLGRYLWWQQLHNGRADGSQNSENRFGGGFAIYDAPEPWGPWTTVYYTEHWDIGPGETGAIPTKWISEDGREFYIVFSGDDYFSVRKGAFHC